MKELVIKTPAKINIGLNIISKREDGYHNLETIFYPIHLFDELTFRVDDKFSFTSNHPGLNSEEHNTIIKAKELISQLTGIEIKTSVTLNKRIPIGAGMGGGSSDGAAALIAFNKIYGLKLGQEDLFALALKIGSDVPYFIDPLPKLAYSRGEVFEHISLMIKKPILIVNPGIHVSTSKAFSSIVPKIPSFRLDRIGTGEHNNISNYYDSITNDFEPIVFKEYPAVKEIKDRLYEWGAEFSLMTGSGSSVFGIFPDTISAEKASSEFPANYFTFIDQYDGDK